MRRLRIEVVVGAIEVYGQEINTIEPVFLSIRLGLDQQHLLGESIRRVGLFRVNMPQIFFAKRHLSKLRVSADPSQTHKLANLHASRMFDEFNPHDSVVIKELTRMEPIRSNATHD